MRPVEVRRREFEVLNKLNHENIVKLFASETEVGFDLSSATVENSTYSAVYCILKRLKVWKMQLKVWRKTASILFSFGTRYFVRFNICDAQFLYWIFAFKFADLVSKIPLY